MAVPKGYTTIEKVENYLLTEIAENFEYQITDWMIQVEDMIDQRTGRNFVADAAATEKSYDGDGSNELLIDDCVDITKLEILTTDGETVYDDLVKDVDYFLEPSNELPKQSIRLYGYRFIKGIQNIKVTAKWGYSAAPPSSIVFAATVLLSNIINYSNQSQGEINTLNVGACSVSFKDQAKRDDFERVEEILESFIKYD
ncbi:MAG: hypothetical protein PHN89_02710 [Candidatus Pacebacteria bacterium]|nr:hypothetical protein [Candidatus Paceibacterota bacterium]